MNVGFIQKRKYHKGNPSMGLSKLCSTQVALGIGATILTPQIKPVKRKFNILINWGLSNSKCPWVHEQFTEAKEPLILVNAPWYVNNSINKFTALNIFKNANIPTIDFSSLKEDAEQWINDGNIVFCRTLVNSYQGKGIVIANKLDELVDAPLYTRRFKKKWEYRVHVCLDEAIKVQQKRRLSPEKLAERGITYSEGLIRSYNNGYIFSNSLDHSIDDEVYQSICNISIDAVKALGLDFGAVDIGVSKSGKIAVFEVNTSPGIEGGTVQCYIDSFRRFIDELQ